MASATWALTDYRADNCAPGSSASMLFHLCRGYMTIQDCYTDALLQVVLHRYPPCFCTHMGRLDRNGQAGEGWDLTLLRKSRSGYNQ